MGMFKKDLRRTYLLIVLVTGLLVMGSSQADALSLRLIPSMGAAVVVEDNGPGDSDPTLGLIIYNGPVGPFVVNVTTGITKPVLGSADYAELDISSVASTEAQGGTLQISLTDTDYQFVNISGGAILTSAVGGTTNGTTTFQSYLSIH
jgi:hypothetical protein